MISVLFFAQLREKMGCDRLERRFDGEMTLGQLKKQLMSEKPEWESALSGNILAAVNQEMVQDNAVLTNQCEVAFFPPVTGG